jgi:hypothetical protein
LFSKDLRDLIVVNRVKTTLPLLITKNKKNWQFYFAQMVEAPGNLSGENDISVTA